jgi:hydrogenase/urease accessory protein HupE
MILRTLALVLIFASSFGQSAWSHALEPGFLEIRPLDEASWRIGWRVPQVSGSAMPIDAVLPENCDTRRAPSLKFDGRAYVSGWIARCEGGITATPLVIEGLELTSTDVLVRFVPEPGAGTQSFRLTPSETEILLPKVPSAWTVLTSYFSLGLDHIAGGLDHLLFVLALLLLVPDVKRLVGAITAFTVAHSITLGAATFNLISLPMPPVEAIIALSIVFLASELLARRDGIPRFSEKNPWSVAFLFGLLHGMGFASALREIGIPEGDVMLALLAFNLGVEAGQLLFVTVALVAGALLAKVIRLPAFRIDDASSPINVVLAYGIGSVAAFWTIERIIGFVA